METIAEGTIIKKAYELCLDKLEEGFLSSEIICHAENINKAKQKILHKVRHDGWKLRYTGEELNYLNVPVVRAKKYDIVIFEGKEVVANDIEDIKRKRERNNYLDGIISNPNIQFCYIRKGSYYAPNCCGYTQYKFQAGVYTKEEAVSEARRVGDVAVESIDIEVHNAMIQDKIADLTSRIIKVGELEAV